MIETINVIILLLPVAPLVALLVANSDVQRRNGLYALAGNLFLVFIWALFINWAMRGDANPHLFKGWVGGVLNLLFYDLWVFVIYGLAVALAGHFANRCALRRIRSKDAHVEM